MSAVSATLAAVADLAAGVAAWPAEDPPEQDAAAVTAWRTVVTAAGRRVQDLKATVEKMVGKAKETDPDRVVYGPQTAQRILEMGATFAQTAAVVLARSERAEELARPLEERRAREAVDAAERVRAETAATAAAEALQRAAEERLRQERAAAELRRREAEDAARAAAAQQRAAAEAAEAERDRLAAAERVAALERARAAKVMAARMEAQRLEDAAALGLDYTLGRLQAQCPSRQAYRRALGALLAVVGHVVASPDEPVFRRVRKANRALTEDLLQYPAGEECLWAVGFREHRTVPVSASDLLERAAADPSGRGFGPLHGESAGRGAAAAGGLGVDAGPRGARAVGATGDGTAPSAAAAAAEAVLVLDEPPMAEDVDAWLHWYEQLKASQATVEAAVAAAERRG